MVLVSWVVRTPWLHPDRVKVAPNSWWIPPSFPGTVCSNQFLLADLCPLLPSRHQPEGRFICRLLWFECAISLRCSCSECLRLIWWRSLRGRGTSWSAPWAAVMWTDCHTWPTPSAEIHHAYPTKTYWDALKLWAKMIVSFLQLWLSGIAGAVRQKGINTLTEAGAPLWPTFNISKKKGCLTQSVGIH